MVESAIREHLAIGRSFDLYLFDHNKGSQSLYEVVTERENRLQELEITVRQLRLENTRLKRAARLQPHSSRRA